MVSCIFFYLTASYKNLLEQTYCLVLKWAKLFCCLYLIPFVHLELNLLSDLLCVFHLGLSLQINRCNFHLDQRIRTVGRKECTQG